MNKFIYLSCVSVAEIGVFFFVSSGQLIGIILQGDTMADSHMAFVHIMNARKSTQI